jgi:hypothetical protein
MVGKLIFKLPEETEDFELAQKAVCYKIALEDLDNWLRGIIKYTEQETINVQEVRDKLHEIMQANDL